MRDGDATDARHAMLETATTSSHALELLRRSRLESPDPLPDLPAPGPAIDAWVYRRSDYELAVLGQIVRDGFAANKFVHYADNYGRPASRVEFACDLPGEACKVRIAAEANVAVSVDGATSTASESNASLILDLPAQGRLTIDVRALDGNPATFRIVGGDNALGSASWRARRHDESEWEAVLLRPGGTEAPHLEPLPSTVVRAEHKDGVYALTAPVLGRVVIRSASPATLSVGETIEEALAPPTLVESNSELVPVGEGEWWSQHALGFKYLSIDAPPDAVVEVHASTPAVATRGAFSCSDAMLNRIWAVSAYTLRLNMQKLMVDAIKRDRMPWAGDQAITTFANAYAFGAGAIARDSSVALGQPTHGYVNGISDYSLWWLINADLYHHYFGDSDHARREAASIHRFLTAIAGHADRQGLFHPADQHDGFADAGRGAVFIDWGVEVEPERVYIPLQMLWYWALSSGARVLERADHPAAPEWKARATTVATALEKTGWDEKASAWREYADGPVSEAPHPHFLGVLAGLTPHHAHADAARQLRRHRRAGTPFMTGFLLRALAACGDPDGAIVRLRSLWGEMIDAGAQTFWEEFADGLDSPWSMYGRPFGKSLCHAWSASPAGTLPEVVLGLRPTSDGWASFSVAPDLGDLQWAQAAVPTPHGLITVSADLHAVTVDIPSGTRACIAGEAHVGPAVVAVSLERSEPPGPTASQVA
ncbi:alpha-L-rhamnosidase C-terminal domain-containing protein [Microbacterium hominis]|uniref:Alpha-L-rhamnosidase n=1 Tax=Microbacterium hominis TaxID=162426 RepID=A0A7D4Q2B0_9MICO|nr:alpha-L-rhamnosidase C-terminal domain-containing protein [Microbacterium hominis]QKJ20518.1 hypothetical protein HQM25_14925 [Microbacterium hominis]